MITIWGRGNSINVQKVVWAAEELKISYDRKDVGGPFGGLDKPEFREMTPHSLIPVIQDGDLTLWESNAIVRYLAARYGAGGFWPEDPAARAEADMWHEWLQCAVYSPFITVFLQLYRVPEEKRDAALIEKSLAQTSSELAKLDRHLSDRRFVGGDSLCFADMLAGAITYRYHEMAIERPRLPKLGEYYARLRERPAYAKAVMLPLS